MKRQHILKLALGLAASAVMLLPAVQASAQTEIPLRGVWQVTRGPVDCATGQPAGPTFPALMSFHRDGILSGQGVSPVTTNAYGPAEFGKWFREPGNKFSFRFIQNRYDDNGAFAGTAIVTATGMLTSADAFTYTSTIDLHDADGNLLASFCGASTGTRFKLNP